MLRANCITRGLTIMPRLGHPSLLRRSESRSHGSLHHNSRQVEGEVFLPKQQALNQRRKNEAEDQRKKCVLRIPVNHHMGRKSGPIRVMIPHLEKHPPSLTPTSSYIRKFCRLQVLNLHAKATQPPRKGDAHFDLTTLTLSRPE